MVRIVSDTSSMYSSDEAAAAGFAVAPLTVTLGGQTYRELNEISGDEFVRLLGQGLIPTSSQPALQDVVSLYEDCGEDEVLNIAMADGLSGTYSTAVTARELVPHGERIEVINTGTLCGPHRYMVEAAAKMACAGACRDRHGTAEGGVRAIDLRAAATDACFHCPRRPWLRRHPGGAGAVNGHQKRTVLCGSPSFCYDLVTILVSMGARLYATSPAGVCTVQSTASSALLQTTSTSSAGK